MAKYHEWLTGEGLLKLGGWARDGLTDQQISHNMGISRETLNQWKKKYSDIYDTLKKGKEVVDIQVENALLKRALGYSYKEVKRKTIDGEEVEVIVTRKEVAPDTTAQIFWLKNRKPAQWRDRMVLTPEVETQNENVLYIAPVEPVEVKEIEINDNNDMDASD